MRHGADTSPIRLKVEIRAVVGFAARVTERVHQQQLHENRFKLDRASRSGVGAGAGVQLVRCCGPGSTYRESQSNRCHRNYQLLDCERRLTRCNSYYMNGTVQFKETGVCVVSGGVYSWQYDFDQVAQVAGISPATMQSWLARHDIPLEAETLHPGRGRVRRFRYADVVTICLIAELQRIGIALEGASQIANWVAGADRSLARLKRPARVKHEPFDSYRGRRKILAFTLELSSTALGPTVTACDPTADIEELQASFTKRFYEDGNTPPPRSITLFNLGEVIRRIDRALEQILAYEGLNG